MRRGSVLWPRHALCGEMNVTPFHPQQALEDHCWVSTGMNRITLRNQFDSLASVPASAEPAQKRHRGQQFEGLLEMLLEADGLSPHIHVRPDGEEIDGSFLLNDRAFLLEAKWHAAPLPASTIYQFKCKVDGKLVGTLGVFISVSGFSTDAVEALIAGKTMNVVLFDRRDVEAAIDRPNGFRTVLLAKLRMAAEEGTVYWPFRSVLTTPKSSEVRVVQEGGQAAPHRIVVIEEEHAEEAILADLIRRIIRHKSLGNGGLDSGGGSHGSTMSVRPEGLSLPPSPPAQ